MKKIFTTIILIGIFRLLSAQEVGLSFSYFIPKNGDFSIPVAPFSFRGIGFDIGKYMGVETGITLYRMGGMGIRDLPFEPDKPLIGTHFSTFVPLELLLQFQSKYLIFKIKGGGFAFYNLGTKIDHGNFDKALKKHLNFAVLNSDMDLKNNLGVGYLVGTEVGFQFSRKFGINLEAQYLNGYSKLNLKGNYVAVKDDGSGIVEEQLDYPDAKLDFSGIEISLGVTMKP